jgi:hypothetical protein
MPESISVPSSGSFENKENTGSQMGQTNKKILKKKNSAVRSKWPSLPSGPILLPPDTLKVSMD